MTPLESIYPKPRVVRLYPTACVMPETESVAFEQLSGARAGAYTITLNENGLAASASDTDGVFSARSALRQLAAHSGERCAAFEIEDWPAFAVRGVMLDISRDRVPTMDSLRDLVGHLSSLRLNHLQLYVEHTFAYAGHELIWQDASPITPDEVRLLDSWCREAGIELSANQNCFGHLSRWLSHERYAHLAETHGMYNFYGIERKGPFSLCPVDPGSLELVSDWLSQLSECFSSRLINVGCDETADLGTGRSREAVATRSRADVYATYVRGICDDARVRGMTPMYWADIALHHPETLELLPPDTIPLAWGYEPDSPFGAWADTLQTHGRRGWVCPGTSCWRSFTGRTAERRGTLAAATTVSDSFDGMLITAWGDLGHRQQWPVTLYAIADAASAAWHGSVCEQTAHAARAVLGSPELGPWLDSLGDLDLPLRATHLTGGGEQAPVLKNASAVFNELHQADSRQAPRGTADDWREIVERVDSLHSTLPASTPHIERELRWTLDVCAMTAGLALARRTDSSTDRVLPQLQRIMNEHASLWNLRSRPGGLHSSLSYFESLLPLANGSAP